MKSALILALFFSAGLLNHPATDGLGAEAILEQAARAQRGAELAHQVTSVDLSLYLKIRDREKGRVEFQVERKFQLPDMIWTRITDTALSGTVQQTGYDGRQGWNHDEKKDQTILLEGPDFRKDLESLQNEMKTMRQLVDFFFLENLRPQLTDLERLPDQSSESGELRSLVVRGRGELDLRAGGPAQVTLWIDADSFRLLGVRLVPDQRPETSEQFCFWRHRPTPQGVVVPGSVKIYRNDEALPSEEIALHTLEGEDGGLLNKISFNQKMDGAQFRPPGS